MYHCDQCSITEAALLVRPVGRNFANNSIEGTVPTSFGALTNLVELCARTTPSAPRACAPIRVYLAVHMRPVLPRYSASACSRPHPNSALERRLAFILRACLAWQGPRQQLRHRRWQPVHGDSAGVVFLVDESRVHVRRGAPSLSTRRAQMWVGCDTYVPHAHTRARAVRRRGVAGASRTRRSVGTYRRASRR